MLLSSFQPYSFAYQLLQGPSSCLPSHLHLSVYCFSWSLAGNSSSPVCLLQFLQYVEFPDLVLCYHFSVENWSEFDSSCRLMKMKMIMDYYIYIFINILSWIDHHKQYPIQSVRFIWGNDRRFHSGCECDECLLCSQWIDYGFCWF